MNVGFEELNTEDVAKMLGVSRCTVTAWCRQGSISYQDLSESGSKRPRFRITEAEVTRIKKLRKKYGRRGWLKYSREGLDDVPLYSNGYEPEIEYYESEEVGEINDDNIAAFENGEMNDDNTSSYISEEVERVPDVRDNLPEEDMSKENILEEDIPTREEFDPEKMMDNLYKIQSLKERLNNLEAERAQILGEIRLIREEFLKVI